MGARHAASWPAFKRLTGWGWWMMVLLFILSAPVLVGAGGFRLAETTQARIKERVLLVGGRANRDEGRYPYMTRIHFVLDDTLGLLAGCGGTLVTPRVVLTAAHCMALARKNGDNIFMRVGAYNPLTDEALRHKFRLRGAKTFVIHPDYVQLPEDQPTGPHDLALIVLNWPVDTSEFPLVRLPDADEPYPGAGEVLQAVGWGGTDSQNTRAAYALQGVGLPAVSLEHCRQQWSYAGATGSLIGNGHLCAGLQSQQNICFGDSGGPLLRLGDGPEDDVQLGITSFSFPECALPGMPSVFTFLPQYRKWIDEQLMKLDPPPPPFPPPRPPVLPPPRPPVLPPPRPRSPPPKPLPSSPPLPERERPLPPAHAKESAAPAPVVKAVAESANGTESAAASKPEAGKEEAGQQTATAAAQGGNSTAQLESGARNQGKSKDPGGGVQQDNAAGGAEQQAGRAEAGMRGGEQKAPPQVDG